ncbi:ABC transporter permease [Roseitranquillus sediminis]|uniref:ABC transporter permease n=1 Tax=Roseitranquillus sediminis TaxID=2809051 RepID=UPI001D0C6F37|nr:ABC transporter permease [Roseitranquillus sediminis]
MSTALSQSPGAGAPRKARSRTGLIWRIVRRRTAAIGLGFVVLMIVLAVFAPWTAPYDPLAQDYTAIRQPPGWTHPFGTDALGRDILSRIIWGARASLLAGTLSVMIAMLIGVPIGLAAGYLGGWTDRIVSRFVDAILAIPFLILAIVLAAALGPSLQNAMIAIGVSAAPLFVRLTRGQVLGAKAEDYVEAARAVGNSHPRIALRHILPNILPALIVQATLTLAAAIVFEASLSFLGLGQTPPNPSWGSMLNDAQRSLSRAPWIAVWPGMAIFLTVLSFNLLGDGLRDALDPRRGST